MKKALLILTSITFLLISCDDVIIENSIESNETPTTNIVFELTANHPDGKSTKAVKTGWEDGDVIFVFFNNVAAPKYLKMSYDGSEWSYIQMNGSVEGSLGLSENATGTMRAVFLPFNCDATVSNSGTSFTFSEAACSYYLTASLDYTVSEGKVSGAFDMQIPTGYIQFFLDDETASSSTEMELREPHIKPQGIASILSDGTITHTDYSLGAPISGYVYDKTIKEIGESKGYLFSGIMDLGARNTSTTYHFVLANGGSTGTYYAKSFKNKTWYRSESEGRALKMPALSNWNLLSDTYLIYKKNQTTFSNGEDWRRIESYLTGFNAKIVEMKFKLAYSSDTYCTIASDNYLKDWWQSLRFSATQLEWCQGDPTDYYNYISLSEAGIGNRASIITLRFDGTTNTLSLNGHEFHVDFDVFDFSYLLVKYNYERDEGAYEDVEGIPDGSRIYYIKGWDTSGNLVYLGYPVREINPKSSIEEYCWYTYYSNSTKYQFAHDAVNQGGYGGNIP